MKACPYPLSDVLPHAAPMVLLDAIDAHDDTGVRTIVRISDDSPFMNNGRVPTYVGVEYMAQTVGVFQGVNALETQEPVKVGFLLGTRKLILSTAFFDVGAILRVEALLLYSDGQIGSFDCRIFLENAVVAAARLTVYETRANALKPSRMDYES